MKAKIKIYNEDCLPAMQRMKDNEFDLAIVDPPYGNNNDAIGIKNGNAHKAKRNEYKLFKNIIPSKEYFKELFRISKNQIIWGWNYFGLKGGAIVWNKNGTIFGEAEIAYCSIINSVRIFSYTWNGMLQENMKNKEQRIHPTQKPVAIYKWLLRNYAKPGDRILDTHLGSGSIAIACWDMDFDLVGYEIDKDYYQAAIKRLKMHKMQLKFNFESQREQRIFTN